MPPPGRPLPPYRRRSGNGRRCLAKGFALNIAISFLAMAIGTVVGVPLGLLQISLLLPVRASSWLVTQFFRNSPWLVLLFYCMLLLPFQI